MDKIDREIMELKQAIKGYASDAALFGFSGTDYSTEITKMRKELIRLQKLKITGKVLSTRGDTYSIGDLREFIA